MQSLEKARVVFIDDIHPQGNPEQVQLVLNLLERRYETVRTCTFLTTNLPTRELGSGDEMLGTTTHEPLCRDPDDDRFLRLRC
ncbi:MAG: DNA replication protein DnaC [Planctomycetaceae bacterium]|jgi:DNA replication protein DnaC